MIKQGRREKCAPVSLKKSEKRIDKCHNLYYNTQAVANAAIAQPVERILGKDEVASSNLASSSKKSVVPFGTADFFTLQPDLNNEI